MEVSDLVKIGRLGRCEDGLFHILLKTSFQSVFDKLNECYLIFNSDRVFFVSISEKKWQNNQLYVRFLEDGIVEERTKHREVYLAIEPEFEDEAIDELEAYIGWTAVFNGKELGTITDYFGNELQQVIVINAPEQPEMMIPFVEHFVDLIIANSKTIIFKNIEQLLEL